MNGLIKAHVLNYLPARLAAQLGPAGQRRPEFLEWLSSDLLRLSSAFIAEHRLLESPFVRGMNSIFDTSRFDLLLNKWVTDYLFQLFGAFERDVPLTLEDNPLHRASAASFERRFSRTLTIHWEPAPGMAARLFSAVAQTASIAWFALNAGLRLQSSRERHVVLREAIWGFERGRYFHDDFIVGGSIAPEGLLLYSRANPQDERAAAREAARASRYAHFDLPDLKLSVRALFGRVVPLYLLRAVPNLLRSVETPHFSLFSSLFSTFIANAIPYEKVFSNYSLVSEFGHNLFSPSHIAEAIVCENHGTAYLLTHWSDLSLHIDEFWLAFLGCDRYLVWGPAHVQGCEVEPAKVEPIGYYFKDRIQGLRADPASLTALRAEMGVPPAAKTVSFFDETFGGDIKMTEAHFLDFWTCILKAARRHPEARVVVKPKGNFFHHQFSEAGRGRFEAIQQEVAALSNVSVLDGAKWSFIETMAISDLVVTQGMTSSATIALMCGIDGLYFDQAAYRHPFSERFKGRLVFDDPAAFLARLDAVLAGTGERPLAVVPLELLRRYDAFPDSRGIDRLRDALAGGLARIKG